MLARSMSDAALTVLIDSLLSEQRRRLIVYPQVAVGALWLTEQDEARFRAKVALPDSNGCALWLKSTDSGGYGQFHLHRRTVKAHLVSWTLAYGDFPLGLEPDHLCNVRRCTAVDHLEWVTHAENVRRTGLRREFCVAGLHRWSDQKPVLRKGGGRECRLCKNANKRRSYAAVSQRPRVKPNADRDRAIREAFTAGESRRAIAAHFGIRYERVCEILRKA